MIERNLAKLVDNDRGVREARVAQQARDQRGFPATEEAGDNADGDQGQMRSLAARW
jgi:hypothetical protein